MSGFDRIVKGTKELMDELFEGVTDKDGVLRSMAEHLGVTDVCAIVEAVPENGVDEETPYPIMHFHVTLAKDVPEEAEEILCRSLNELNNVIAVGDFPSFGNFAYFPRLKQVYLTYRMIVNPDVPDQELFNIRYYLGVLYEQLDLFADFIMFICDNNGQILSLDAYLDYLSEIRDCDEIEERVRLLEKKIDAYQKAYQ